MRDAAGRQQGFTLVEVTIILMVLVIISMIMLPQLGNFNRLARKVKVMEDLGVICATLKKFLDEVMVNGPYAEPGGGYKRPYWPVGLLVGPGMAPRDSRNVDHKTLDGDWSVRPVPSEFGDLEVRTDINGFQPVDFFVDRFENHLMRNDPLAASYEPNERYKNQAENPEVGAFLGWRGPYFDTVTSDPWGTRYASNTFGLHVSKRGFTFSTAVVCYSAGPNQTAETGINQPIGEWPYGWVTGGDDLAVVLSGVGPF